MNLCKAILFLLGASLALGVSAQSAASSMGKSSFNEGWKFFPGDVKDGYSTGVDDTKWRQLDLPHDWSIEGSFSEQNPATFSGGALPGGIGWYRKSFTLPASDGEKMIYVEFDGIYRNAEVWINGQYLGKSPYGYSSFRYDITPYIKTGTSNLIAVRVDNSAQPNSRWYSGSGIYRNVWLVKTAKTAIDHWGTYITTPYVTDEQARLLIRTRIRNSTGKPCTILLRNEVYDNSNKLVASSPLTLVLTDTLTDVVRETMVKEPKLWSDESPNLYTVLTRIIRDGIETDWYRTTIGIRSFTFDAAKGFILNGKQVKIRGVCNHHDLGCLGAAINIRALERQLELLKSMGCNGIRTSHNPPAPELLDLCDKMGFIVMDEAFDMWKMKKTDFDYSLDWDNWHKRDIQDMVLRDRNHPSIFMWSIGNEIPEQWDTSGSRIAAELVACVKQLDDTRPVTSACNFPEPGSSIIRSGKLDLIGYNYHEKTYADFPKVFPGQKFIASETTSSLATRGSYDFPADSVRRWPIRWDIPFTEGNPDYSCSAFDNCCAPWGSTHEDSWKLIRDYDYLSGMYIWTGFDYLGEPTPYGWPAHSSYFGILDLCGFPKDAFYMYQSEWTTKPMLHLLPHWNWPAGKKVDVWAYTNCSEVELFLNGRSLGTRIKDKDHIHLSWSVPFEPGTLLAIARTNGKEVAREEIKTAGKAARISITPDRTTSVASGSDLVYCTVQVLDKDNVPVPNAANLVKFTIEGDAQIAGVDNGNPVSLEPFKSNQRKAFNGKCLVVVQTGKSAGMITVTATSKGLKTGTATITNK